MQIIVLSDIHGAAASLPKVAAELEEADLVVLPGDLTNFGSLDDARDILETVQRFNESVLAVAGNCDLAECEDFFEEARVNLGGQKKVIDGIEFFGIGGSLPCPVKTLNERSEPDLKRALDDLVQQRDPNLPCILVSHQPPSNTNADVIANGQHVGSTSVRAFIEQCQPLICFTGHIHEAFSLDEVGKTRVVNSGSWAQGRYAIAEIDGEVQHVELRSV